MWLDDIPTYGILSDICDIMNQAFIAINPAIIYNTGDSAPPHLTRRIFRYQNAVLLAPIHHQQYQH